MKRLIRRLNQERRDLGPLHFWEVKELVSNLINRSDLVYGRRLGRRFHPDFLALDLPTYACGVLKNEDEVVRARRVVAQAGLPHHLGAKDWDTLIAFRQVIESTTTRGRVLDAGAELSSVILLWLYLYGYRDLVGINLAFFGGLRRGSILYEPGDITRTKYATGEFDAVTCLSVIEHQVPLEPFFAEMARILRKDGRLIVSTDYWDPKIPTGDVQDRYFKGAAQRFESSDWTIFSKSEIDDMVGVAGRHGLQLTSPFDMTCGEPTVTDRGKAYTFLCVTFARN